MLYLKHGEKKEMIVLRLTPVACPLFWSQTLVLMTDIPLFFLHTGNNHVVEDCLMRYRLAEATIKGPVLHRDATAVSSCADFNLHVPLQTRRGQ